jgi:capsule polysaccharide export protein KpsE/RkpR
MTESGSNNNIITRKLFIVKRRTRSGDYEPICLYDENQNFRGPAIFTKKSEAEQYMKTYREKLLVHFQGNSRVNPNLKTAFKVFEVDGRTISALMRH